ncbi:MAG TPA: M1 family metallopeptidase [Longimicrobiales bacterium]|nr:M1 family metallopeptidase [Longimicrobiales bacterium]
MRMRTLLLFVLFSSACADRDDRGAAPAPAEHDSHSYARPAEARVTHVSLDLVPDFDSRRIGGTARLTVERGTNADSIILDIDDLAIRGISAANGDTLAFTVGVDDPHMGQPLIVRLPPVGDTIVIEYETSPDASAVQWLEPSQTAGGRMPFLFTQGQAILTRSWVPTQDSPGIRQTYDATIHVPAGMRAVMSAELLTPAGEAGSDNRVAYRFALDQPIPPYLIALAIGDLEFREIGPRSGVWAEPGVVARAAAEFGEVEQMMDAAERLYGPYRWGRYDILVLPPSFPFGGMENPRLTFATPTILAGDRSLVSLIAHELAHSWSGNLVTNATWADFWLNEGFTTYLEARIMEELRGAHYADMLRQLGRQDLQATIDELGATSPETRLHLDLTGRNPDDGMMSIAYEKGAAFLETVESVVGRDRLDAFLRRYFDAHAFQPMTAEQFIAYMDEHLFESAQEVARVRAREWIFEPGLPDNAPVVTPVRFVAVDQQVEAFRTGTPPSQLETSEWSTHEWLRFLRALPDTMSAQQLASLDQAFGLTRSGNSEILFVWLRAAIRNQYQPAMPALERFLTTQGRRKFIAPLFTDLMAAGDRGAAMARSIYAQARPTYHAITRNTVDEIVK